MQSLSQESTIDHVLCSHKLRTVQAPSLCPAHEAAVMRRRAPQPGERRLSQRRCPLELLSQRLYGSHTHTAGALERLHAAF